MDNTEKVWSIEDALIDIAKDIQPGDTIRVCGIGDCITRISFRNSSQSEIGSYSIIN